MDMPKSAHLEEINHLSITEPIDEMFNNITAMMTDSALMYGGTVNAILAGLPVNGDLDIAISSMEFMKMAKNLANSTMWLQVEGRHITEDETGRFRRDDLKWSPPSSVPGQRSNYDGSSMPMSQVVAFETVNGNKVHIIESKIETGDPLEDALHIIRSVDLRCCGVGLDKFGRLLEAVKAGFEDSVNRILMLNMTDRLLDSKRTKGRMHKYVKRGWSLGITIEQAVANINKANLEAARKEAARQAKYKGKSRPSSPGWRVLRTNKAHCHEIRVHNRLIVAANNDLAEVRHRILNIAVHEYNFHLNMDDSLLHSKNYVMFIPNGNRISKQSLEDIMHKAVEQLKKSFGPSFISKLNKYSPDKARKKRLKKEPYSSGVGGYTSGETYNLTSTSAGYASSFPSIEQAEQATDEDDAPDAGPVEHHGLLDEDDAPSEVEHHALLEQIAHEVPFADQHQQVEANIQEMEALEAIANADSEITFNGHIVQSGPEPTEGGLPTETEDDLLDDEWLDNQNPEGN